MITITQATNRHLPQLEVLLNSAYRGESAQQGWTSETHLVAGDLRTDQQELQSLQQAPGAAFLIAQDEENGLIGCVYLCPQEQRMYLGMLAVLPNLQAKGLGKMLLQAAEAYARAAGLTAIYMTVISARKELIEWYQRHGYQLTGATTPWEVPTKYGQPTQALEFVALEKSV